MRKSLRNSSRKKLRNLLLPFSYSQVYNDYCESNKCQSINAKAINAKAINAGAINAKAIYTRLIIVRPGNGPGRRGHPHAVSDHQK